MFYFLDLGNDQIVAARVEGKLTHADYAEHLMPRLEAAIKKHGKVRFYLDLKGFEGWEWQAAWDDFKTGVTHRHDIEKIALLGDHQWEEWASKIFGLMMDGQMKFFPREQAEVARAWITSS